jgi:hypothetical protein
LAKALAASELRRDRERGECVIIFPFFEAPLPFRFSMMSQPMGHAIEQRTRYPGICENARPFSKGKNSSSRNSVGAIVPVEGR